MERTNNSKLQIYTTSILMLVASADEKIEESEITIIKEILIDFFKINKEQSNKLILLSEEIIKESTDIYEIASFLNNEFSQEDKIELLYCIFEVAYCDKDFHFMERHVINKIANILNINRRELLKANKEIQNILLL